MSIAPTVCLLAYVWVLLAVRHTNRTTIHSWNHRSKGLPVVDVEQLSNRRCFILYPQSRSLSVEWLSLLLLRSHCVSHTVCSTSGFWVKQCGQPDLNFLAHSHPPHRSLISYSCRSSEGLPCRPLSAVFPRHLQHVSFLCGRERKWNGKSAPPPHPLRPHGKGRRAVGQEPAGHSRAYLWSPLSSLQSEALCSPGSPPRCCSPLPLANPKKRRSREQPEKMHFLLTHYVPLFFLSQTIYTDGGWHMKRDHPSAGMVVAGGGEESGHISRAVHRCPSHSGQDEWLPSIGSLSLRHTLSETRGKGNTQTHTQTHTHTIYINNGNTRFTRRTQRRLTPLWPPPISFLMTSLSPAAFVSLRRASPLNWTTVLSFLLA